MLSLLHVEQLIPAIIAIIGVSLALVQAVARKRSGRPPPSPFKLPFIGNLHQLLGPLPHRSLHALSRQHGPLMLLQLGQVPTLVVSSPAAAREIMKTQDHIFANRPSLRVPTRLFYGCQDVAFAPLGEYWRHARKHTVRHLLNPQRVRSFRRIRQEEIAFLTQKISALSSIGPVNMSEVLSSFAKDVISRVTFGKCSREEGWNETVDGLIDKSNHLLGAFHAGDYIPSLAWLSALSGLDAMVEDAFVKIDRLLDDIVDNHCSGDDPCDQPRNKAFVEILLSLKDDPDIDVHQFNKNSIKAILEGLFGAGADSIMIVLEWCMAELIVHPEVTKKLQHEVRRLSCAQDNVQEDDLIKMNYLKAVVKETMRLHPPGPLLIPRELMEDTIVLGYNIANKTRVIVNAWAIGRDPNFWDDPEEFRPERFTHNPVDFRGNDFKFIPFGGGRRVCPGISLAISVIELTLANLLKQFNWGLPRGMTRDDMDMLEAPGISCHKKITLLLDANMFISSHNQPVNA